VTKAPQAGIRRAIPVICAAINRFGTTLRRA
jgi:hypothetical protein